jgi:aerotolerance regulator-like protein/VWA domain-containing protein
MPFAFLAPLFLAGALAIAVPIIVHLTHKQRDDVKLFPSLMFVRQVPFKSTRKQRIRHWFLLLLRAGALIMIAAAFARPFLDRPIPPPPEGTGALDRVILLDRSYSMGYVGRWEAALAAAREATNGIGSADRATLVLFDERADAIRSQDGDVTAIRSALNEAKPGSRATSYAPAFRQALSTLQSSERPRREVVLISDLQRSGWSTREAMELPDGTQLRVVDVGVENADNFGVAGVNFARAAYAGSERITATARIVNRSAKPITTTVVLELADRESERKQLTVPANQSGGVQFSPFTLGRNEMRGAVIAGSDALPADNRFNFVLSADQAVTVSIVRGPRQRGDETLYLEQALSAEGETNFHVVLPGTALPDEALRPNSVVILNDVSANAGDLRRLRRFVESGGGVLIALGQRAGSWRGETAGLLPGRVGGEVDRSPTTPGRIAELQYSHRVFEAFRAPRAGDFTAARFYRYRELNVDNPDAVLARFDDGRPALAEHRLGRGRVLVWTSTLDNYWNDAPVQPVFPPFVREAGAYLSGASGQATSRLAGTVLDAAPLFSGATNASAQNIVVASPSGERTTLEGSSTSLFTLEEQGYYQLRVAGQDRARSVAVNVNFAESDLARINEEEIRSAIAMTSAGTKSSVEETTPAENERRQAIWWNLLVMAAMLLAAESIISNRLSRIARA